MQTLRIVDWAVEIEGFGCPCHTSYHRGLSVGHKSAGCDRGSSCGRLRDGVGSQHPFHDGTGRYGWDRAGGAGRAAGGFPRTGTPRGGPGPAAAVFGSAAIAAAGVHAVPSTGRTDGPVSGTAARDRRSGAPHSARRVGVPIWPLIRILGAGLTCREPGAVGYDGQTFWVA